MADTSSIDYARMAQALVPDWYKEDLPEKPTMVHLNGYIITKLTSYQLSVDENLHEYFVEDFGEWNMLRWNSVRGELLRFLRDLLRAHGVLVKTSNSKIAQRLMDTAASEYIANWPSEEVTKQSRVGGFNHSSLQYKRMQAPSTVTPLFDVKPTFKPSQPPSQFLGTPTPVALPPQRPLQQPESQYQPAEQTQTAIQWQPAGPSQNSADNRLLADLMKVYQDSNRKYTGDKYDFVSKKMTIFTDTCDKLLVPERLQSRAVSSALTGRALDYYYDRILPEKPSTLQQIVQMLKLHFETPELQQEYVVEWNALTLYEVIAANSSRTTIECFIILLDKLKKVQPGLIKPMQNDYTLHQKVISACQGHPDCSPALYRPAQTIDGLCSEIRYTITSRERERRMAAQFYATDDTHNAHPAADNQDSAQYWTDRTYGYSNAPRRSDTAKRGTRGGYRGPEPRGFHPGNRGSSSHSSGFDSLRTKKCYVCGKQDCWSTKHSVSERKAAYAKFKETTYLLDGDTHHASSESYHQFLFSYEGQPTDFDFDSDEHSPTPEANQSNKLEVSEEQYFTEFGEIEPIRMLSILNDQAVMHAATTSDPFTTLPRDNLHLSRYDNRTFQGILPDTGASGVSTAGHGQLLALQKLKPDIYLDHSTRGSFNVKFGKGETSSLGTVSVDTPIGEVDFQVLPTDTPFLLCLKDMDRLKVSYDNMTNTMVQGSKRIPVIRKWGHPWILLDKAESMAWCNLTEAELRQLHRRFGHPSTKRLSDVLNRGKYDFDSKVLARIQEVCHQCQVHARAPGRFRFKLHDDTLEFNSEIIVDVFYLDSKPVIHIIDAATSFQSAQFLRSMSTRAIWEAIRSSWIDVYLGPPETIVHDAGKNFTSIEFKQYAQSLMISTKEVPVEAHHSVGKVERYHGPLRRAYDIIKSEMPTSPIDCVLQTAVKAINDSAGPSGLIPTLLVFGSYPRISALDTTPDIQQRAKAITKAMNELRTIQTVRQVRDALNTRNGPDVTNTLSLAINDDVLVWREIENWTGPWKVVRINGDDVTVQLLHGPTTFRSTSVKPYIPDKHPTENLGPANDVVVDLTPTESVPTTNDHDAGLDSVTDTNLDPFAYLPPRALPPPPKRGPGRPKGSKNRPKPPVTNVYLSAKEISDAELAITLRAQGTITTPGKPFELSDKSEIDALIADRIFRIIPFDPTVHKGRIFKSRLVRAIKEPTSDHPIEKSRLVIQGFMDKDRPFLLTQAPTIQRASQRLILALAPLLRPFDISIKLRDITMAYTQSTTPLNRQVMASLPHEISHLYPPNMIMAIDRPLYGICESGTHWWASYTNHHKETLKMVTSAHDPCLLITTADSVGFGVVGMQTDDTIILADPQFDAYEDETMIFRSKPKEALTATHPVTFNGCMVSTNLAGQIISTQKGQGKRLSLVDPQSPTATKQYVEQRARGAYLATICQPEATFDLSVAAQVSTPTADDINSLNKRLAWQMDNLNRGITHVPFDIHTAKIYVFVDGSFANNKDLTSQLGFLVAIGNETVEKDSNLVTIRCNLISWSSVKSKRVTRSVLASEIYGMVAGVDMAYSISTSVNQILGQLSIKPLPIIACTDSFSLYECMVKLGSTKEKRLMIDIMALRQMYERRELFEVRWISGDTNPADAMTKSNANHALKDLIDTNEIKVKVEGWVMRTQGQSSPVSLDHRDVSTLR